MPFFLDSVSSCDSSFLNWGIKSNITRGCGKDRLYKYIFNGEPVDTATTTEENHHANYFSVNWNWNLTHLMQLLRWLEFSIQVYGNAEGRMLHFQVSRLMHLIISFMFSINKVYQQVEISPVGEIRENSNYYDQINGSFSVNEKYFIPRQLKKWSFLFVWLGCKLKT